MPNSVMPKGVEHHRSKLTAQLRWRVSNSVMPKGVEHTCMPVLALDAHGVEFSDAERR